VNVLVAGFEVEEMRRLSEELRAAGHHVLGAAGKQGALTFLRAVLPDVVVVPSGADGEQARGWVLELGLAVPFFEVPIAGADLAQRLERFARGESAAVPESLPERIELTPPSRSQRRPSRDEEVADEGYVREPHPELVSKLAQVRFGDYHSILEVEPGGSPYAVREQHERLARRFSPRGWPARLNPDEIDMLNEITRGLADAFLILGDPELAVRYERALAGGRPVASPSSPTALPR